MGDKKTKKNNKIEANTLIGIDKRSSDIQQSAGSECDTNRYDVDIRVNGSPHFSFFKYVKSDITRLQCNCISS